MSKPVFRRIVIVGVGLIGGSIGLSAKKRWGRKIHILGLGRRLASLQRAKRLGAIDEFHPDPGQALREADAVFLCMPLGETKNWLTRLKPHLSAQTLITDVGSVKGPVVKAARKALGARFPQFVPAHPIAGSEKRGVESASENLFEGARVILTPTKKTATRGLRQVASFWRALGAEPVFMPADVHDRLISATSHLPHVLASALVQTAATRGKNGLIRPLVGGSFRDLSRVAESSASLWVDIALSNRPEILKSIRLFERRLQQLTRLLKRGTAREIEKEFERSKKARQALCRTSGALGFDPRGRTP